jgi:S-DNA-T family DNA segregation ATPase FtsK/SpoIIIE
MTTNAEIAAPRRAAPRRAAPTSATTPPDEVIPAVEEAAPVKSEAAKVVSRFDAIGMAGFAPAVLGAVLGIALASHVPADPSQNVLGNLGAQLATGIYEKIGAAAWVGVVFLVAWGGRIVLRRRLAGFAKVFFGAILAVGAGALAMSVIWPVPDWPLRNGLGGGYLGDILYAEIVLMMSKIGIAHDTAGWIALAVSVASLHMSLGGQFRIDPRLIEIANTLRQFRMPMIALPKRRPAQKPEILPQLDSHILGNDTDAPAPKRRRKKGKTVFQNIVESDPSMTYELPPFELLAVPEPASEDTQLDQEALDEGARHLAAVLADFNIKGEVVGVKPGPVVTLYEFEPAPGTKTSRVTGLADDIARSMSATSARTAAIPGRKAIGIEIPNESREMVRLRELVEGGSFEEDDRTLAMALGKDIGGFPVISDLAKMPHLLIAGTTGSGKSVGINTMILSLLYRLTPNECRFIMIDPKMLELTCYADIPHLLSPVVTDPVEAAAALNWVVIEMESRYKAMSAYGVRSFAGYNDHVLKLADEAAVAAAEAARNPPADDAEQSAEQEEVAPPPNPMPLIVVFIDEVADLMMAAGKEVEISVQRIAQKARAAGIHLIMATQRPSADVITGTIKANFATRISFRVSSKIDSRTVLGEAGAETLLGHGDMLFQEGGGKMTRVHGAFVGDDEVEAVANFLRAQGTPDYINAVTGGDGPHAD